MENNEQFNNTYSSPSGTPPAEGGSAGKKGLVIALVVVLIILAALGGYYFGMRRATAPADKVQNETAEQSSANYIEEKGDEQAAISISNWSTYVNFEYGFSFKYPEGVNTSEYEGQGTPVALYQGMEGVVNVSKENNDPKDLGLLFTVGTLPDKNFVDKSSYKLNQGGDFDCNETKPFYGNSNLQVAATRTGDLGFPVTQFVFLKADGSNLVIQVHGTEDSIAERPELEQILKTFDIEGGSVGPQCVEDFPRG